MQQIRILPTFFGTWSIVFKRLYRKFSNKIHVHDFFWIYGAYHTQMTVKNEVGLFERKLSERPECHFGVYDRDWCLDIGIVYNKFYVLKKKKNLEGLVGFLCYVRYDLLWARILGPCEIIILIEWLLETHLELEKLHNSTSSTVLLSVRSSIPQKKLTSLPELQQSYPLCIITTLSAFLATLGTF